MKFTKNYHLPQWVEDDLILMDDFNKMNEDIENGLTTVDGKADAAAAVAENARQNSVAAFRPGYMPYAVGAYNGTGEDVTIELGFRPSFVIISGTTYTYSSDSGTLPFYNIFTGGHVLSNFVVFTDTGFVVRKRPDKEYPKLVERRTYDYIAFR